MSSFGISRVARDANKPTRLADGPGPGSFETPGAMQSKGPGFTPFGSSSQRGNLVQGNPKETTPAPGDYMISIDIGKASDALAAQTFKSKVQRFVPSKKHDGPESYNIPSCIKSGKPKVFPGTKNGRPGINPDALVIRERAPPSIPTRKQSTGYETDNNGKLILQDAVDPGFEGTPNNMVGPGDYEPRPELVKYANTFGATMRGADRNQLYKSMEKAGGQAPGPGYYNYRGVFDEYDNSDQTNMVVRLTQAKNKLSSDPSGLQ